MVKVGIVGISGYSGLVALELLVKHPKVQITYISANNSKGNLQDIWPELKIDLNLFCDTYSEEEAINLCDCLFLAVPHTIAMEITPGLLKAGKTVIDLSGDYRLENDHDYKKWYGADHQDTANLATAVYGLPELYREDIKNAKLISNPGCYPTAAILGLAPIVTGKGDQISSIIIDAKSGVTGAGRKAHLKFKSSDQSENFKAYKPLTHQHAPEIELYLSKLNSKAVTVDFVPHLLPVERGILETIYVRLNEKIDLKEVTTLYKRFFKTEKFVRILEPGTLPELKNVAHTNYCDISLNVNKDNDLLVISCAIDNLMKGASGQAVQNFNIMHGLKEEECLL